MSLPVTDSPALRGALSACPLFAGMDGAELAGALRFFEARLVEHRRGEFLNRIGDPLSEFGLVVEGSIQVYMDDYDGHHMIMANVAAGESFAESLCYLGRAVPIYICAVTDAVVLHLSCRKLKGCAAGRSACDGSCLDGVPAEQRPCAGYTHRFITMLAGRTLSMNDRIQILSRPTLRGRLVTFFSQYARRFGRSFSVPFDRSDMAAYLGTDRSALSRELGRMQAEGLLRFRKNSFEILQGMEHAE